MKSKTFGLFIPSGLILIGTIVVASFWDNLGLGENKIALAIFTTVAFGISIGGLIIGVGELKINKSTKNWIGVIGNTIVVGFFAFMIVFSISLQNYRPKQIEEFNSHRGSWNHTLKLYDNSGYTYTEQLNNKNSEVDLRDTGNYKLADKEITLNSLDGKIEVNKKKSRKFKMFKNRTFILDNDTIFITGRVQLKDSTDSIGFNMNNLFAVPVKK